MVRTFEQRNLIEEGKFTNTEGVFLVFEGFCGIYMNKPNSKPKKDEFGRIITEKTNTEDEEGKAAEELPLPQTK